MGAAILRTVQVGIALIIITALTIAVMVILGMMPGEEGMRIGLNVAAIIALAIGAGIALAALFGIGRGRGDGS